MVSPQPFDLNRVFERTKGRWVGEGGEESFEFWNMIQSGRPVVPSEHLFCIVVHFGCFVSNSLVLCEFMFLVCVRCYLQ